SYDVSITNIGVDDLLGPLMLLIDPGQYFGAGIAAAVQGTGNQHNLWLLDLTAALAATGNKLGAGATLANQTVARLPAQLFSNTGAAGRLVQSEPSHGVYPLTYAIPPPQIEAIDAAGTLQGMLAGPAARQAWTH